MPRLLAATNPRTGETFVKVDVHALTTTHNSHMQPFQRPFYSTSLHVPGLAGYPLK